MEAAAFYGSTQHKSPLINRIENIVEKSTRKSGRKSVDPREPIGDGQLRGYRPCFDPLTSRLLGPTIVWKTFHRQAEALDYARTADDVHVFAFESEFLRDGKRRFLVTSYEHFWHTYLQVELMQRHHYEVIPENSPVKLYFDLEFDKVENRTLDATNMVDFLITEVSNLLTEMFPGHPLFRTDSNVVKLDASTATKFSHHLVFPEVVFSDHAQLGFFVKFLCEAIARRSAQRLSVKNADKRSILFIDQGVYTKNRNFRVYLSRKLGKNNPLLLAPESQYQDCSHREIFLQTLICNVPFNSRRRLLQFDPPVAQDSGIPQIDKVTEFPLPNVVVNGRNGTPSPYPEIDRFFQCIVSRDCLNGYIRQWQHFPQTDSLVYIISGQYKFCERIGRHHKSNNILFVAHVSAGMYHQKCLDPECRAVNYRSRDYLLPCLRLPEINTGEAPYAGAETAISRAGNLRPPLHTLGDDADEHEFISSLPMDIFEDQ